MYLVIQKLLLWQPKQQQKSLGVVVIETRFLHAQENAAAIAFERRPAFAVLGAAP